MATSRNTEPGESSDFQLYPRRILELLNREVGLNLQAQPLAQRSD